MFSYVLHNFGGQKAVSEDPRAGGAGRSPLSLRESGAVFERRYFRGAKGDYGEEAIKLLWVCAKNQRHWMNQQMANDEECESRLRQTESADVAAGIGVRKT